MSNLTPDFMKFPSFLSLSFHIHTSYSRTMCNREPSQLCAELLDCQYGGVIDSWERWAQIKALEWVSDTNHSLKVFCSYVIATRQLRIERGVLNEFQLLTIYRTVWLIDSWGHICASFSRQVPCSSGSVLSINCTIELQCLVRFFRHVSLTMWSSLSNLHLSLNVSQPDCVSLLLEQSTLISLRLTSLQSEHMCQMNFIREWQVFCSEPVCPIHPGSRCKLTCFKFWVPSKEPDSLSSKKWLGKMSQSSPHRASRIPGTWVCDSQS